MKKLFLVAILLSTCLGLASAQGDTDRRDSRIATYRAEVFTRVLRLSPAEAQGFWPVYNGYLDKKEDLQRSLNINKQEDQMSDGEVEDHIKRYFERKQRDLDLEKDLYQNLRSVLPIRKIAKIPFAEREFREALIKKLQDNRQKRMQDRRQNGGRG